MNKKIVLIIIAISTLFFGANFSFAESQVVPCQLTNADQDTLRLFPDRTNYRKEFIRTDEMGDSRKIGGDALYKELERRLGDKWDPIWETKDIPYVFYEILKGPDRIGWSFGANQGWPGADNSQLMFAFDLDGRIQEFYYQKLPSFEKELLQTKDFYAQFIGLTLEHFYAHEQLVNLGAKDKDILEIDMISRIADPTQKEHEGFQRTLRGTKKVLVYGDDFRFGNRIKKEAVFENVKYVVENKDKIPLLGNDALAQIKKIFPDASRFVLDLVALKDKSAVIQERLGDKLDTPDSVSPIYVVYKDDAYKDPFVRGSILGYVAPITAETAQGKITAVVAIGAVDKEKGKIVSLQANKADFAKFKGISLSHFYTKDYLLKTNITDEKIDKIAPLTNFMLDGKDVSNELRHSAKKALVIVDEFYFHNFFKKDEIMKKIEEYLKKK